MTNEPDDPTPSGDEGSEHDAATPRAAAGPPRETDTGRDHVLLVGHGAPAHDTPRELVARWKALEGRRRSRGEPEPSAEEAALDEQLRSWPRTVENDPYKAGLEAFAQELRRALAPLPVHVAYNEFCAPSVMAAAEDLVRQGARRVVLVPTMVIPGGVHSEVEIPEEIERLAQRHPSVIWQYAWPFPMGALAAFFGAQVARALAR